MTGKDVRRIRRKLGISQSEMAARLGLKRYQTVTEYETGKKPVSARSAVTLKLIEADIPTRKERRIKPEGG